jgi:hypothetical protein
MKFKVKSMKRGNHEVEVVTEKLAGCVDELVVKVDGLEVASMSRYGVLAISTRTLAMLNLGLYLTGTPEHIWP